MVLNNFSCAYLAYILFDEVSFHVFEEHLAQSLFGLFVDY